MASFQDETTLVRGSNCTQVSPPGSATATDSYYFITTMESVHAFFWEIETSFMTRLYF